MDPVEPKRRASANSQSSPGGQFAQLALWMAANLAGLLTAVLLSRGPFFESLLDRVGRGASSNRKPTPGQSLPRLAGAIVGSDKSTIESVFGPPRSAAVKEVGIVVLPQVVYWQADTWYYPLQRNGMMAMAINFDDDLATQVEFFTAPTPPPA
jgi:hypothetical protein